MPADASHWGVAPGLGAAVTLKKFKQKLNEYASNNITALMGTIQITQNERSDLMMLYNQLDPKDRLKAAKMLEEKGIAVEP
jgi:hypothetical protein